MFSLVCSTDLTNDWPYHGFISLWEMNGCIPSVEFDRTVYHVGSSAYVVILTSSGWIRHGSTLCLGSGCISLLAFYFSMHNVCMYYSLHQSISLPFLFFSFLLFLFFSPFSFLFFLFSLVFSFFSPFSPFTCTHTHTHKHVHTHTHKHVHTHTNTTHHYTPLHTGLNTIFCSN